jgi:hypothetical protein
METRTFLPQGEMRADKRNRHYSSMELVMAPGQLRESRSLQLQRVILPVVICSLLVFAVLGRSQADSSESRLSMSQLTEDPNNYTLVEQAIQEQTTLPQAEVRPQIPADIKKHMEAIAQIQQSADDKVDYNLTMPDSIKKLLDQIELMKHGHLTDHVLSHVNITGQVKPIPLEIVAGAKQAENEMVADDVVNSSP